MSDSNQRTIRVTAKGHWTVARMREIDPEAFADLSRREMVRRRGIAFLKALADWDAQNG